MPELRWNSMWRHKECSEESLWQYRVDWVSPELSFYTWGSENDTETHWVSTVGIIIQFCCSWADSLWVYLLHLILWVTVAYFSSREMLSKCVETVLVSSGSWLNEPYSVRLDSEEEKQQLALLVPGWGQWRPQLMTGLSASWSFMPNTTGLCLTLPVLCSQADRATQPLYPAFAKNLCF